MNHINLKIIVDVRKQHLYSIHRRLEFFAHNAKVRLIDLEKRTHFRTYAIVKN